MGFFGKKANITISIGLILSIFFVFVIVINKLIELDYMSADELEKCYMNNKVQFDTVAYELTQKVNDIDVDYYGRLEEITYEKFKNKKNNYYIYISNNMVIYPNENSQIDYNGLKYFNMHFSLYDVLKLMKRTDLIHIDIYKDYLLFVNKENFNSKVCLIYSEKDDLVNNHFYNCERIADNWYYCVIE